MGSGQAVARDREEGSMIAAHKIAISLRDQGPTTAAGMALRTKISATHCGALLRQLAHEGYADVVEILRIKHQRNTRPTPVYRFANRGLPPSGREVHFTHPADHTRVESPTQALAFKIAMRGQRYDSVRERSAIARFDLARVDAPSWSSLA
jgi:hypothetical protein